MNYDIYGIGAALVDTEITVSDEELSQWKIEKGVMTLVDEARQTELIQLMENHLVASKRASGGSAANSIIAASYFGSKCYYSCRVADDENGHFYLSDLSQAKVDFRKPENNTGVTGKCLVMITPDAERTMNTFLGISETLSIAEINEEALKNTKYAYIEGYLVTSNTGKPAAIQLREMAEKHKVKTAISLSDPAIVNYFREGLGEIIGQGVDLIFCNKEEAINYTETQNLEEAVEALKKISGQFAITLGADGAFVYDGKQAHTIQAPKTTAIDTNGAGDMFAGACLHGLSQGLSLSVAASFACKAAASVVSQYGPRLAPQQYTALLETSR